MLRQRALRDVLASAFELLPIRAYVVDGADRVVYANRKGRSSPIRTDSGLEIAASAVPAGLRVLAVLPGLDVAERLGLLADRWGLTPRERPVFDLLVHGATNKRIGDKLGCSESAASVHVMHIVRKAGLSTRGAVVAVFWNHRGDGTDGGRKGLLTPKALKQAVAERSVGFVDRSTGGRR